MPVDVDAPPPPPPLNDPPPPYPSRQRHPRRNRRRHVQHISSADSDLEGPQVFQQQPFPSDPNETTPLLSPSSPRSSVRLSGIVLGRPRTLSQSSTLRSSASAAPSLAYTVFSLFRPSPDSDDEYDPEQDTDDPARPLVCSPEPLRSRRVPSSRAWKKYFSVLGRVAYWSPLFHLLVLNFPYALAAWVYLFVFTLTGTTLLMALPLGAVLCFFDLLGARAFARGELALQSTFHGPLAYPPPYPPRPIFTRMRPPTAAEIEAGTTGLLYETSFYKNAYAMFTDSTSYQALFYFLVIKPSITLIFSLLLITVVPVCMILVLPAPAALRAVRRLGAWQANVAVEGLYMAVS